MSLRVKACKDLVLVKSTNPDGVYRDDNAIHINMVIQNGADVRMVKIYCVHILLSTSQVTAK